MNIVTIGGGHGQSVTLRALMMLLSEQDMDLSVTGVVPHTDSGGSTGRIIDGSSMLPMGDWLKCLMALSHGEDARSQVIQMIAGHRFSKEQCPALAGHLGGNFLLAALLAIHQDNVRAVLNDASVLFGNCPQFPIWPASQKPAVLRAVDINGQMLEGERLIDMPDKQPRKLMKVELINSLPALPEVIAAIEAADAIIFGPGDLFTSILPCVLVKGAAEALRRNERAQRIFVLNVMTKSTETWEMPASLFVEILEEHTSAPMTHVIVNSGSPLPDLLHAYRAEGKEPIVDDLPEHRQGCIILRADVISGADAAHHNPRILSDVLQGILHGDGE